MYVAVSYGREYSPPFSVRVRFAESKSKTGTDAIKCPELTVRSAVILTPSPRVLSSPIVSGVSTDTCLDPMTRPGNVVPDTLWNTTLPPTVSMAEMVEKSKAELSPSVIVWVAPSSLPPRAPSVPPIWIWSPVRVTSYPPM